MSNVLAKWLLYRFLLGWVPFLFGFLSITVFKDLPGPIPIKSLFNSGQLWLVGFALCGGAVGEVSFSQLKGGWLKGSLLFLTLVLGIVGAFAFARTTDTNVHCTAFIKTPSKDALECAARISLIASYSFCFYCISALAAFFTIVICEKIKQASSSIPPDDKG